MTVIDKISFRFGMADEQFARNLYAGWDGFCRRCVTDILDEFFAPYDRKDTGIEIELLELDLGSIPQQRFYDEFPTRLREALERSFVQHLNKAGVLQTLPSDKAKTTGDERIALGAEKPSSHSRQKRFENLKHYLEQGFCLPEWDRPDFDIYEELLLFSDEEHGEQLLSLLAFKPYIIERLFLQLGEEGLAQIMSLSGWLWSPAFSQYEKKRYLAAVLERAPQSVIRFIHKTNDTGRTDGMAELLESPHVKRIMVAQAEHHAEIDLPEYWHRLYEWMLEYYPFSGVAMFGDKPHFRLHLNKRLLSFIRKRNSPAYLSVAELTVQFLLEVFGADYYLTVLDIIYHNQRLNADGSPATGDSYAWELYHMLLRLSLIKIRQPAKKDTNKPPAPENPDNRSPHTTVSVALSEQIHSFEKWLADATLTEGVKRISLWRMAKQNPELLVRWLQSQPEKRHLSLLATWINEPTVVLLAGAVSMQLAEIAAALFNGLDRVSTSVSWLKEANSNKLTTALNLALLEGAATGLFSASDGAAIQVLRIGGLLYREITGTEIPIAIDVCGIYSNAVDVQKASGPASTKDNAIPEPLRELLGVVATQLPLLSLDDRIYEKMLPEIPSDKDTPAGGEISSLKNILSDGHLSDATKKMLVLQWLDTRHGQQSELISALQPDGLLNKVVDLLRDSTLRHIAMQLAENVFSTRGLRADAAAVRFIGLLADNIEALAGLVSRPTKDVWFTLILSLASPKSRSAARSAANSTESAVQLLGILVGTDLIEAAAALLIEGLSRSSDIETPERQNSDAGRFTGWSESDALWPLLIRIQAHALAWKRDGGELSTIRTAVEKQLNSIAEKSGHPDTDREKWEAAKEQIIDPLSYTDNAAGNNRPIRTIGKNNLPVFTEPQSGRNETTFSDMASWLIGSSASDTAKSQRLRQYARWQPKLLWEFVRYAASDNTGDDRIPLRQWSEWLGTEVWLEMIAGVSLTLGETLRQITGAVADKYPKSVLSEGLVRFIVGCPNERIYYGDTLSTIREYISLLPPIEWQDDMGVSTQGQTEQVHAQASRSDSNEQPLAEDVSDKERGNNSEVLIKEVEAVLHTAHAERSLTTAVEPEYIEIPNAGLCLLAPWMQRLFGRLGLLTNDRRDLKHTEARIRAIFILQRLVTDQNREYKEQELAFNRLLTGCPFYVPLPKTLELTDNEIQTAESMLVGVKANWEKLRNTSIKGFVSNFIERPGRLEQLEQRWTLEVEERAYDILLDSLPWSYSHIRLPWMKKQIKVMWRNKNDFDF